MSTAKRRRSNDGGGGGDDKKKPTALGIGGAYGAKRPGFCAVLAESGDEPRIAVVQKGNSTVAVLPESACTQDLLVLLDNACEGGAARASAKKALREFKEKHPKYWCFGLVALAGVQISRLYVI